MSVIEKRRFERKVLNNHECYCQISLPHGFASVVCNIVDVSPMGIRLRSSYRPSEGNEIMISDPQDENGMNKKYTKLSVKWSKQVNSNRQKFYEAGCKIICKNDGNNSDSTNLIFIKENLWPQKQS